MAERRACPPTVILLPSTAIVACTRNYSASDYLSWTAIARHAGIVFFVMDGCDMPGLCHAWIVL